MQNATDKIQMFALIEQWKASGMNQQSFCELKAIRIQIIPGFSLDTPVADLYSKVGNKIVPKSVIKKRQSR